MPPIISHYLKPDICSIYEKLYLIKCYQDQENSSTGWNTEFASERAGLPSSARSTEKSQGQTPSTKSGEHLNVTRDNSNIQSSS